MRIFNTHAGCERSIKLLRPHSHLILVPQSAKTQFSNYLLRKMYFSVFFSKMSWKMRMTFAKSMVHSFVRTHAKFQILPPHNHLTLVRNRNIPNFQYVFAEKIALWQFSHKLPGTGKRPLHDLWSTPLLTHMQNLKSIPPIALSHLFHKRFFRK